MWYSYIHVLIKKKYLFQLTQLILHKQYFYQVTSNGLSFIKNKIEQFIKV